MIQKLATLSFQRIQRKGASRLVQVLDLDGIFGLANVPRDASRQPNTNSSIERDMGTKLQYISFLLGETQCALPISDVQEVFEIETITRSAIAGRSCLGTTELRGGTVPIIDLAALLGCRPTPREDVTGHSVVVMRRESELFGLLVESVEDIITVYQSEVVSFPTIELAKPDLFVGGIVRDGAPDVLALNHKAILADEEVCEVTRVHDKMFTSPLRVHSRRHNGHETTERETFMTFSAGTKYAVRINEIQEIIDLPKSLMRPPGLGGNFTGVHNLRGQTLVAIADMRQLCGHDDYRRIQNARKVLIFGARGDKIG